MSLPSVAMSAGDLAGALTQSKVQETAAGGIGGFLKFDFETGEWSYGREAEEVTGDEVLVNTTSIGHGWTLWHQGEADKRIVRFNEPLPEPQEAITYKDKQGKTKVDEPSQARTWSGAFFPAGEGGEADQCIFDTNSYGGRKGVDSLLAAIKTRAVAGHTDLYPLIKLDSESYFNKSYNKEIHNPVFTVVGWYDEHGNTVSGELDAPAEEPAAETQESAPETAPEPEAPKRRRRRNAA